MSNESIHDILIVKIGALGDAVLSLCMLPYLKETHQGCRITCVCGRLVAPLFKQTGLVDEIIQVDEKPLGTGRLFSKICFMVKLWKTLFWRKFDLVLMAHPHSRYHWITLPVRAKITRSWDHLGARRFPVPGRYHADEYMRLASGIDGCFHLPVVFPEMGGTQKFSFESSYIVIAPGGAESSLVHGACRKWPIESYAKVIAELGKYTTVVVTGALTDIWVRPFLTGRYVDLIGQASILDLLSIFQKADLFISHDTGPLHLAKLVKCQTLALFGPTNPAEFTSNRENIHVLWGGEHLPCSPCYDGKSYAPCANHLCMKSITPEQVIDKARKLIQRRPF